MYRRPHHPAVQGHVASTELAGINPPHTGQGTAGICRLAASRIGRSHTAGAVQPSAQSERGVCLVRGTATCYTETGKEGVNKRNFASPFDTQITDFN